MDIVRSVNGVPIRLTNERWRHIADRHEVLADSREAVLLAVGRPYAVVDGTEGEYWAIARHGRLWIVVPYRETSAEDGFIITAFVAHDDPAEGRDVLWP